MSRALVSLATGGHQELLDIAVPSFEAFADRHGYDLILNPAVVSDRPVSWWKVPVLRAVLEEYDEALWVDADVVIVDAADDVDVPVGAWQGLVRHSTADGDVPNCGVWFVRDRMIPVLEQVWGMTHRIGAGWWEQAALMDLMGFRVDRPAVLVSPTPLYEHTHWLDHGWNVHIWDLPGPERPRFMHASMHEDRAAVMRAWAAGDVPPVPATRCRHMYQVSQCPGCRIAA